MQRDAWLSRRRNKRVDARMAGRDVSYLVMTVRELVDLHAYLRTVK
jgi:hypothetical protein